jgi:hypothetical protein
MDWIELAQARDRWRSLVNVVNNFRVSYHAGNFLISCKPVTFSRRILFHGISIAERRATVTFLTPVRTVLYNTCPKVPVSHLATHPIGASAFLLGTKSSASLILYTDIRKMQHVHAPGWFKR